MFCSIHIPDFLAEAILRARPELRRQAVAVVEGAPPLAYVVAVNDHARRLGLHIGMARVQAEALQANQARNARDSRPAAVRDVNATTGDSRFHLVRDSAHMSNAQENGWLMAPTIGEASEHPRNTSSYARWASRTSSASRTTDTGISIALCQRSAQQEAAAHASLLDAAHALSPNVEDTAADIIVLDLAGLDRLFGAPQAIARELSRRITEVGLEANIAIASNPQAAIHAACGFPGTTIIPEGAEADRLGSLPIEILCANYHPVVDENTSSRRRRSVATRNAGETRKRIERLVETLDRWGIRNFHALAALPPVSLSERLGADGVRLQQLATGGCARDLLLHDAPLVFEEALELEYPVDLMESLAFLLSRMIEQLCARLSARALSTTELRLRMELEHRTADEATASRDELADIAHIADRKLALPVPMNDARLFLKLLQLELQSNPPGAPVTKLWLSAEPSRPRVAQAGLFVPLTPEPEKLELTLARIHRVLRGAKPDDLSSDEPGAGLRAGTPELLDTHQPDAFRMTRFRPAPPDERDREIRADELRTAQTLLPLRLFRPSLVAHVDVCDGRPVRIVCAQLGVKSATTDNIVWVAGPWRTSGNWWMEGEEVVAGCQLPVAVEAVPGSQFSVSKKPSSGKPNQELRTKNGELGTCFARDEWDIALAITTNRTGEAHVALHRIYQDLASGAWRVSGSYD